MRLRKADLRGRVNANLEFRFTHPGLTSYAGLEFVRRYVGTIRLVHQLRRYLNAHVPRTDFGIPSMILLLLALVISGGRRVRHLLYLEAIPSCSDSAD